MIKLVLETSVTSDQWEQIQTVLNKSTPTPDDVAENWILIPAEPTPEMIAGMREATFLNDGSDLEMERRFNGMLENIPKSRRNPPLNFQKYAKKPAATQPTVAE